MGDWIKIPQVGVVLNPRQERTRKMLALGLSMAQISRMTSTSQDVVEDDICTIHAADFMNQKLGGKMKDTRINKWSDDDLAQLIALRQTGATSAEIAVKLGRTVGAVKLKLHELRKKGAMVEPEPSTQEAAPQPEESSAHIPQCVLDTVRNEVDRITYRVTMMQAELERATAQRDELRHWLEAHAEGER